MRSPLCGAEPPWFAPVVRGGGVVVVGGLHFGLMRRALMFAPRSTPNELLLIAVTLFSQGRVAALSLVVAAEERQHAIYHCLG
jgi:DNA helicase HerA-like ATPase